MATSLWKSKEQRMHDDANELLDHAHRWISASGSVEHLSEEDLKWVEEKKAQAQAIRVTAAGSRYGWEDLMRYVVAPLLIVVVPLILVCLIAGGIIQGKT